MAMVLTHSEFFTLVSEQLFSVDRGLFEFSEVDNLTYQANSIHARHRSVRPANTSLPSDQFLVRACQ